MCQSWLGKGLMYELEERRIENAYYARDMSEVDSWAWNYWNNVIGTLVRRLNDRLNT
jgi:hypothetical protein